MSLGLPDADVQGILTSVQLSYKMKTVEMLRRWHSVNGYAAHYRVLVEAWLRLDNAELAKQFCQVLKGVVLDLCTTLRHL